MPTPTLSAARKAVRAKATPARAKSNAWFFKTGPGQYGEGDRFIGVSVPDLRVIARAFEGLSHEATLELLASRWHEERLLALLILVAAFERGSPAEQKRIAADYLASTRYVNNWDLVDSSAPQIVGAHVARSRSIALLRRLARSKNLWERRIAIIATFYFIRQGKLDPTLEIAELLIDDDPDLIQKAVGWMLREVGNRDLAAEEAFLKRHYRTMPRTALRYAIEKFPPARRKQYLLGTV